MENQVNIPPLLDGGIRERDGYLGDPVWTMDQNDSTYYNPTLDSQCTVPARSLREIKAELGIDQILESKENVDKGHCKTKN